MATLNAGNIFGIYQGYYGDPYNIGSLSPDTFGGFTCAALITGYTAGSVTAFFSGNATSFLTGQSIVIDGTTYSTITSGPTFDGSTTSIEWAYGPGNFTVGNSYSIDIGAGGPASPNITSASTVPNLIGTKLAHTVTIDKTAASMAITGGADAAEFEVYGTTGLRFASDALSDTAGSYVVEVTVTDTDGLTATQTITVPVKYILYVGGKVWSREGATSTTNVSLTDLTGGIASAPAENDYVVVMQGIGSNADRAVATTSGYTELADIYANGTTYDANLGVDAKFMGSTPDTTVTIGSSGSANDAQAARIMVFRGVDLTTPMDVAVVTATGTGTAKPNPGAITPITTGAVGVFSGAQAAATAAALTSSDLTAFASVNQADTNDIAVGAGYIEWSGSGAMDPAVFGGGSNNSANSWAAVSIALRPAYTSGGGPATYNETLTESTAAAQSATTTATFPNTRAETVASTASEAVSLAAPTTLSESLTASDDQTAALTHQPALAETLTAAESSSTSASFASALSESGTVGESSTTTATFASEASESVTGDDSAGSGAAFLSTRAEDIAANDNAAAGSVIPASVDEAASAGETASSSHDAASTLTEAISAAESSAASSTIDASLDESIAASEEATASVEGGAVTYDETLSEAVTAGESAATVATLAAARSEALTPASSQASAAIMQSVRSESLTPGDAAQSRATMGASIDEQATASAAQSIAAIFAYALSEPVAANDDEAVVLSIDEALEETAGATDAYEGEGGNQLPPSTARTIIDAHGSRIIIGGPSERIIGAGASDRTILTAAGSRTIKSVVSGR